MAALYIATGKLGFLLAIPPGNVTAVWPPSGIALGAMLLLGNRAWLGVGLGSFLLNDWFFSGFANPLSPVALLTASAIAAGSTLQALLGASLIRRWIGPEGPIDRPRGLFRFVGIEGLSCVVASTAGVSSLFLAGFGSWSAYAYTWLTWWLGDFTGILIVTPLLLAWSRPPWPLPGGGALFEGLVLLVAILGAGILVFGGDPRWSVLAYPLSFAFLPFIMWAGVRFGPRGVTGWILLVSALAVWGTAHGFGPFARPTLNESLLLLETFVGLLAVAGLALSAAVQENKRAEGELRRAHEELEDRVEERTAELQKYAAEIQDLYNLAPCGYHSLDGSGVFLRINDTELAWLGYAREELVGRKKLAELLTPASVRIFERHFPRFKRRGWVRNVELEFVRKDGTVLPALINATAVKDSSGRFVMSRTTLHDLTELKNAQRLRAEIEERKRMDKLKDQFLGIVSHELRTPITILQSALFNLAEKLAGPLNPAQARMVELACSNAGRLGSMIEKLLDLSRLESGKAQVNRRSVDLPSLLRDILRAFHLPADERGLVLELDLPSALPEVQADPDMIAQVLHNLLDNAVRFAKRKILVRSREASEAGPPATPGEVRISVADDGPGIPADSMNDLFSKFYQVNRPSGGGGYKGTGLGLAICREIIQLHQGRIWVESSAGPGACFHFTLPLSEAATAEARGKGNAGSGSGELSA